MSTAIDRVKSALEACTHARGTNGTRRRMRLGRKEVVAVVDPLVELPAKDIHELAETIAEDKRSQIVKDLHMGVSEVIEYRPGELVHIKVDDAWHLLEAASGAKPA